MVQMARISDYIVSHILRSASSSHDPSPAKDQRIIENWIQEHTGWHFGSFAVCKATFSDNSECYLLDIPTDLTEDAALECIAVAFIGSNRKI